MPKYVTGYRKYSEALEQKFRMQLLCTEGKWWLRLRFFPSQELVEIDLPPSFNAHKFLEEASMLCYWSYFRRRHVLPITSEVFEKTDICTKVYKIWYIQQRLFSYEANDDIYLSVLVQMTSREPTKTWEKYERNSKPNSRYQYWD